MHSWRSRHVLAVAVSCLALLTVAGSAVGAGGKGPAKAKIVIKGAESFKANVYDNNTFHFDPGTVTIRPGGTVTLTNTTTDAHSLSIVTQAQFTNSSASAMISSTTNRVPSAKTSKVSLIHSRTPATPR
jgi:plastocyanin